MVSACNCSEIFALANRVDGLERIVQSADTDSAGLAAFADTWWIVVLAYAMVIFPWGIMYNLDFISEKWRTVHRTRFLARTHLAFAIVPMPFIVFYAHLQQISQDYKEMMAAVVAIFMSLYHVLRTCWGLLQVTYFSKWCSVLVKHMLRMQVIWDMYDWAHIFEFRNPEGWKPEYSHDAEVIKEQILSGQSVSEVLEPLGDNDIVRLGSAIVDNLRPVELSTSKECAEYFNKRMENVLMENVQHLLKVNNTIVDNEFFGTDMSLKIDMRNAQWSNPSALLNMDDKELCTVRWCGSFLSSFAEYWNGQRRNPVELDTLLDECLRSRFSLELVTFPVDNKQVNFQRMKWKDGGPYNSSLDISGISAPRYWLNQRTRELENLMSGFPSTDGRQKLRRPDSALAHAVVCAQSIDEVTFDSLIDYHEKFTVPSDFVTGPRRLIRGQRSGWHLLLWQCGELPSDRKSHLMDPNSFPPFPWRYLMVPLWDNCTNWRVLQASVHEDNKERSFEVHSREDYAVQPSCWFEYSHQKYAEKYAGDRSVLYSPYAGVVLEAVRTFLADWVPYRTVNSMKPDLWRPPLSNNQFQFSTNQDLDINLEFWKWECQSKLHQAIADMDMNEVNLPSSIELILLFILGLPELMNEFITPSPETLPTREGGGSQETAVLTEVSEDVLLKSLELSAELAPQDVNVRIRIFGVEGKEEKKVTVELMPGRSVTFFNWEDWINSVMGYLKGIDDAVSSINRIWGVLEALDDAVSSKELKDDEVPWRKRTPCKVNLSRPLVTVSTGQELPKLRGDIRVWAGWPFFDIKIVQFEMNECMRAAGCLNGYREMVEPAADEIENDFEESGHRDFADEVKNAEEVLMMIITAVAEACSG